MEILSRYISDELLYSIGWTIFHSIWIGALLSLLLFISLVFLAKSSAKSRYNISMAALLILVAAVSAIFMHTLNSSDQKALNLPTVSELLPAMSTPALPDTLFDEGSTITQGISQKIAIFLNSNYYIISLLWLLGILLMTIRFAGGLVFSGRLGKSNSGQLTSKYSVMLTRLKDKLGLERKVEIVESYISRVPLTSGWIKPVIYIPIGAFAGIPYNQVEAILAHELAHIKRNDYLVNILQSMIEILLFYHPAVWWISSVIRSERESACDDIAVELSDEKLTYIKALVSISEFESGTTGAAVAFAGDSTNLLNRIKRIAKMKKGKMNRTDKWTSAFMSIIILAGVTILTGFRTEPGVDSSPAPQTNISEISGAPEYQIQQLAEIDQQDPVKVSGKITRTITDPADGKEKEAVFTFKNGELSALSIEGREIPRSDFHLYKEESGEALDALIEVIEDMEDALVDIEEAMEEIEEIDIEEIELEIQEAISEIEELNMEEIELEIQEALSEIQELELEDLKIDMEEILMEVEESLKEIEEIDMKKIEFEMQEAIKEINEIDIEKMRKEMLESLEGLEEINIEEIMQEMEESMQEIQESLNDLDIDQRKIIEDQKKHFETQKKELEKQLIQIQEQETSTEKKTSSKKKKENIRS